MHYFGNGFGSWAMVVDRAVVVAQLAEWSLKTPDVCGSSPGMDEFL